MNLKRFTLISLLLMIFCVGAVSAANETNTLSNEDVEEEISVLEETDTLNDDNLCVSDDNDAIKGSTEFEGTTFSELQGNITSSNEGDVIYLNNDIKQTGDEEIVINKSVTVDGKGHTIDAQQKSRIFTVNAENVVLKNIKFINGNITSNNGGAIYWNGVNGTVINSTFTNNTANGLYTETGWIYGLGGAIYCNNKNFKVDGGIFENNNGIHGGAIYVDDGGAGININNSQFINHHVLNYGGALYCKVDCDINNSIFTNNRGIYGGAIYTDSSAENFNITYCEFTYNEACGANPAKGGAIYTCSQNMLIQSTVFLYNKALTNNIEAEYGGTLNVTFTGWENYFNAIFADEKVNQIFYNNITYWNGEIVNSDSYPQEKSLLEVGVNITLEILRVYKVTDEKVLIHNLSALTNEEGVASFDYSNLPSGFYKLIYYHPEDYYYTNQKSTVSITINTTFTNLQKLIDSVEENGTLILKNDFSYDANTDEATLGGILINKTITIDGGGFAINSNNRNRLFNITADNVVLMNLFLTEGIKSYDGRAIYWSGNNGKVINCTFKNNYLGGSSFKNGTLYWAGDNGSLINSTFINNYARYGGSVYWIGANGEIVNSNFSENVAAAYGAAVYIASNTMKISNCNFNNNSADESIDVSYSDDSNGGAICLSSGNLTLSDSVFFNNTALNYGNAIATLPGSVLSLSNNTFNSTEADILISGSILSDVTVEILNNETYNIQSGDSINVTAVIYDDNSNRIALGVAESGTITGYDYITLTVNGNDNATASYNDTLFQYVAEITFPSKGQKIISANKINNKTSFKTGRIIVDKAESGFVEISSIYINYDENETVNVTGKVSHPSEFAAYSGLITVTITTDSEVITCHANAVDGSFSVPVNVSGVDAGIYTISVKGNESVDYYEIASNDTAKLTVSQVKIDFDEITSLPIQYGFDNTVNVTGKITCNFSTNVTVSVENNNVTVKSDKYGNFEATLTLNQPLATGTYDVTIAVDGDKNHIGNEKTFTDNLTVTKANVNITSLSIEEVIYLMNQTVTVKGIADTSIIFGEKYTGLINISVENKPDVSVCTNICEDGSFEAVLNISSFSAGKYNITTYIEGNENYANTSNIFTNNLTVLRLDVEVENVTVSPVVYGDNAVVNITGKVSNNYSGEVLISFEGYNQTVSANKSGYFKAAIQLTDAINGGSYDVSIKVTGDENYNPLNVTYPEKFIVKPANLILENITGDSMSYGEKNTVTIKGNVKSNISGEFGLNYTGKITVTIQNTSYTNSTSVNEDGSFEVIFSLNDYKIGNYTLNINVEGNDNYNSTQGIYQDYIKISRANVTVKDISAESFVYGKNNTVILRGNVKSNITSGLADNYTGKITVSILNTTYSNFTTVNEDGTFEIIIVLDETYIHIGNYSLNVTVEGDDHYNAANMEFENNLTVEKAVAKIESLEDISVIYGENSTVYVVGKFESVEYGANYSGEINVQIADINITSDVVKSNFNVTVNGVQYYSAGEYAITVKGFENENYTESAVKNATFKINKAQFEIDANITGVSEGDVKTDQNATVTVDTSNIPSSQFNVTGVIVVNVEGIDKNYTIEVPVTVNTITLDVISQPGTYTLNVQYIGDKNYNASNIVTKTFTVSNWNESDLQELIDSSEGNVTLEHDYTFTGENATVNVNETVTINGNGHTINAGGSSAAVNIAADNAVVENITLTGVSGTALAFNGTNTTVNNVAFENVNGTAIQIEGDNANVNNISSSSTGGKLVDISGDNITVTNVNSTGNATIALDGKINKTENITGANITLAMSVTNVVSGNNVIITALISADDGNVTVEFKGKKYTSELADGKAVITVPVSEQGTFTLPVIYSGNALYQSVSATTRFTSKVDITGNKNVKTDYLSGYEYTVRILNADGTYASGVTVTMTIAGVTYSKKTDSNGYAKLLINLKPKTYTITVKYSNVKKTNKIEVKSTISLVKKTIKVKKTAKKLVLKAKLKWSNGKAIKGKVIKFKFKGKTYKAKTNSKGIAKVKIKKKVIKKLKKGKKYKFKAIYVKEYVKGKVKVKK